MRALVWRCLETWREEMVGTLCGLEKTDDSVSWPSWSGDTPLGKESSWVGQPIYTNRFSLPIWQLLWSSELFAEALKLGDTTHPEFYFPGKHDHRISCSNLLFLNRWQLPEIQRWISNIFLSFCELCSLCIAAHIAASQRPAKEQGCCSTLVSGGVNEKSRLSGDVFALGCEGGMLPGAMAS